MSTVSTLPTCTNSLGDSAVSIYSLYTRTQSSVSAASTLLHFMYKTTHVLVSSNLYDSYITSNVLIVWDVEHTT